MIPIEVDTHKLAVYTNALLALIALFIGIGAGVHGDYSKAVIWIILSGANAGFAILGFNDISQNGGSGE